MKRAVPIDMPDCYVTKPDNPNWRITQESWFFEGIVPADVCDRISQDAVDNFPLVTASIEVPSRQEGVRNGSVRWMPTFHWACSLLAGYVALANALNFRYDIRQAEPYTQFSEYRIGDFYGWHTDSPGVKGGIGPEGYIRRLSATLQLSDPRGYKGGKLQLMSTTGEAVDCPDRIGTVIVFDSRWQHRVTPVTKGHRDSLVQWYSGPQVR